PDLRRSPSQTSHREHEQHCVQSSTASARSRLGVHFSTQGVHFSTPGGLFLYPGSRAFGLNNVRTPRQHSSSRSSKYPHGVRGRVGSLSLTQFVHSSLTNTSAQSRSIALWTSCCPISSTSSTKCWTG